MKPRFSRRKLEETFHKLIFMPKFQFMSSSLKWPDLDFFLRWDELQHSGGGSKRQKRDSSSNKMQAATKSRIHEQFTNYLLRTSSSEVGLAEDKQFTYLKHINKALADRDYNPSTFEKEADNFLKV